MAPSSISEVKKQKKSAFSCEPCRSRKVKCGGEHPTCNRCKARKDACVYKLAPTLSYTQKLESRITELEKALSQAQQSQSAVTVQSPRTVTSSSPHSSTAGGEGSTSAFGNSFKGLAFDAKGAITYHGATSFFQLPPGPKPSSSDDKGVMILKQAQPDHGRQKLIQNAEAQRIREVLFETPEPFQYLLNNHWCWIQPLFNFVYRPAFTRDMQTLGQYYSHTLLNAMLAHSVRWCKREPQIRHQLEQYEGGAIFSRAARLSLFEEISTGNCNIPTVQVLLLLSAQECSKGNRTQAWIYCGMAFRLIEDMGITFDGQRYAGDVHLTDEDKEVRRRLFWSCYFWDKIISLYLGRSPSLQHTPVSPPQIMVDDSAEMEIWEPHGVNFSKDFRYPRHEARSISCFSHMCRLSVIFHEILVHVYDPVQSKAEVEVEECLLREGQAMREWWNDLPDFLRIDPLSLPQHAPPSHIVTLNCLFHTFKILLYRPMLFRRSEDQVATPDPAHFKECLASANAIMAIFDLFCRTFGYGRVVLSLAYSVYTAASIFLLQIQASSSRDESTIQRMQFCVQALHRVKDASPVIGDALNLIIKALSDAGIDTSSMIVQQAQPTGLSPSKGFLVPSNGNGHASTPQAQQPQQQQQPPQPPQHTYADLSPATDFNFNNGDSLFLPQNQYQGISAFDIDGLEFNAEMFEAFSTLEPMTATVGLPHQESGPT